jgi:uncharacterized membrane protein
MSTAPRDAAAVPSVDPARIGEPSGLDRRRRRYRHPVNQRRHDNRTPGQRLADSVTAVFGSWRFIITQTVIVVIWIAVNVVAVLGRWDRYPFILLNLLFSTQAAYAAPLILLSQNRQTDTDRLKAEHDYGVNQLALQYLIAWHRDAHGPACRCVQDTEPVVEGLLEALAEDL